MPHDSNTLYIHPSIATDLLHRATLDSADIAVLPWPQRPHGRVAWVAVLSDEHISDALDAEVDAICLHLHALSARLTEALHRRDARLHSAGFRRAVELSTDTIEIGTPSAVLTYTNPSFSHRTGVPPQDAIGKTPAQLFRTQYHSPEFYQSIDRSLASSGYWEGTLVGKHALGGLLFSEFRVATIYSRGDVVRNLAIKRPLEHTPPRSTEITSTLLRAVPAIAIVDRNGVIVEANHTLRALLCCGREDLVGRVANELLSEPLLPSSDLQPGEVRVVDAELHSTNRSLEVELEIHQTLGGLRAFSVWIVRDIHLRKARERELESARQEAVRANKTKSIFLANMSHELRTPLNVIIGYSELLEETINDPNGDLRRIREAGSHLLSLVNDILDLAGIEHGREPLSLVELDLTQIIRAVTQQLRTITPPSVELLTNTPNTLPFIGDRRRIRQVLINLIQNAIKFTPVGTVTVQATSTDDSVCIEVIDSGLGMTETEVQKIFEPFTQANSKIRATYGGTGLGLAISHSLIRAMGGCLTVRSTIKLGTTFTIRLPRG